MVFFKDKTFSFPDSISLVSLIVILTFYGYMRPLMKPLYIYIYTYTYLYNFLCCYLLFVYYLSIDIRRFYTYLPTLYYAQLYPLLTLIPLIFWLKFSLFPCSLCLLNHAILCLCMHLSLFFYLFYHATWCCVLSKNPLFLYLFPDQDFSIVMLLLDMEPSHRTILQYFLWYFILRKETKLH